MNGLDEVNSAGEQADGFVWRYKDDSGAVVDTLPYDDRRMMINLTVWESVEQLREFAYQGIHVEFFRRRSEWFEPEDRASYVLWWTIPGEIPTVDEAMVRLEYLRAHGPTALAFGFKDAKTFDQVAVATDSLVLSGRQRIGRAERDQATQRVAER